MDDQFSIKNLLFTKAIPNYVTPAPTASCIVHACTDCGDKYLLASSYDYHINRKSVKITYFCRLCNTSKTFFNRCNLLAHIRSHAFKTATINVSDLKLEPLPLKYYKNYKNIIAMTQNGNETSSHTTSSHSSVTIQEQQTSEKDNEGNGIEFCYECNTEVSSIGTNPLFKNRAKHYMQVTSEVYTCPLCLFTLPTTCALKSHMRFHYKYPPYYCPECGMHLTQRSTHYPFDHKCEGFMMMRATARVKCPVPDCPMLHPNELREHLKNKHLKTVFKCPHCYVACFDASIMGNHLKQHKTHTKCLVFYQCEMCPGKLVLQNQVDNHSKLHLANNYVHPCWTCKKLFKDVFSLTTHHLSSHSHNIHDSIKSWLEQMLEFQMRKKIYRVVKKCDQCKRSFSYKCKFDQINMLPNECPYKCTNASVNETLTCHMCQNKISQNWKDIVKHFKEFHESHRCIDVKIIVPKLDIKKYLPGKKKRNLQNSVTKKKRRAKNIRNKKMESDTVLSNESNDPVNKNPFSTSEFLCKICGQDYENKEYLEKHLLTHRDPCMAYQCMECGQSFVVKPTFSKHLLLVHNISNVEDYIIEKGCYNENALMKYKDNPMPVEPLRENQCKICREQFENSSDLEKHFRVHGMAFLMQNNSNKAISI